MIAKVLIEKIFTSVPLVLLYVLCFTELNLESVFYLQFFSFNVNAMLVYFWTLKRPQMLGSGHIFFANLINDVVLGLPLGTSPLTYLALALVATYIKNSTIHQRFSTDWFAFIPAIFFAYGINFIMIIKFSDLTISYNDIVRNSFFTFLFFPFFYYLFKTYSEKLGLDTDA
jgi:rod shape-determining protein MreD